MKKISIKNLPTIAASHEDSNDPGVLKKVLFTDQDIPTLGKIKMINWAILPKGKSFIPHYHEDMDEIFIIISGKVRIQINDESDLLEKGDSILIRMNAVHRMENIGKKDVHYIVIGISLNTGGKTVRVD